MRITGDPHSDRHDTHVSRPGSKPRCKRPASRPFFENSPPGPRPISARIKDGDGSGRRRNDIDRRGRQRASTDIDLTVPADSGLNTLVHDSEAAVRNPSGARTPWVDCCCATRYTPCVASSQNRSAEVGRYIRRQVIPQGMSVTEAARRLGVGRPALSNLLNGRAALSQKMALRLEATFGADRTQLLELQAASDRDRRRAEDRAVPVGAYVPDFLTIKARQIADWASNIQSRERLPVFLRHLIHATGRELSEVDFPGYDNAQRHGWDGWVVAGAAAPWVPEGRSGWELSVEQRPREKADHDYRMRRNKVSPAERAELTFVFVTPHNWEGKTRWAWGKQDAGEWKAVRAFDASDLEQWLETTISPRIWLAQELDLSTEGFETLDSFWNRWAKASDPPMTAAIFAPSIVAHLDAFKKWLGAPSARPFRVTADSREEAVAFLACLLRHEDAPAAALGRAVVFKSASTLRTLAQSSSPFIPIVYDEECEREIAAAYRQHHCIVVRPRNAVYREPDIAVELLDYVAFEKALSGMGIGSERVDRLARESGRSPTVLRRRLSQIEAIKTPPWARDEEVARRLMPMTLVGAWHRGSKADREVLAALAHCDYDEVKAGIASLPREDSPVWCVDQYHGVVSKIDALFAISRLITTKDVDDFLVCAECVLSESEPALKLPENQRWAAGFYGKVREHSSALRTGVCETLVLLAVHGNALFREGLGIDVAVRVADFVKRLLTPLTSDKLRSHDRDLPEYAEAAPDQFLALLEEDLRRSKPNLLAILKPTDAGLFNHPAGTGTLWALERLAWNPRTFPRVVRILARLSQKEIDDNWANQAMNSLSAVFRSWLPQTAAPLDDRIQALEMLCRHFREVGWQVCLHQLERGNHRVGHFSSRPRWRNDAAGAGRKIPPNRERHEFRRKALDLALEWRPHDGITLGGLVEHLDCMEESERSSVWNLVEIWSKSKADDKARKELRERIRRTVLTPVGLRDLEAEGDRARQICENLASRDPVVRHGWLFAEAWVETSVPEDRDGHVDWEAQDKRIHELRRSAMAEIWSSSGAEGTFALLADCDGWTVGRYAAGCAVKQEVAVDVLRSALSNQADAGERVDAFMCGFLGSVDEHIGSALISTLAETCGSDQIVRLFTCAPFRSQTWHLLDRQVRYVIDRYWRVVIVPRLAQLSEAEVAEVVDNLLEAGRPQDAFDVARIDWTKVETSRLKRLLTDLGSVRTGRGDNLENYYLSKALESLDGRPGVTMDEMVRLEFAHIEALDRSEHGIPNLERELAESPSLFVRVLALAFKRGDSGEGPPEWRVDDGDPRDLCAYRLLQKAAHVPGTDPEGKVDVRALRRWVAEARRLCSEHGRTEVGDIQIGQLLSRAPSEEDGSWPCRSVCEVVEAVASPEIASGFESGVYNGRGVVRRSMGEGGVQERRLSAQYRAWAQRWAWDYPRVGGILERIAQSYDRDAKREDFQVRTWKRLHH